MCKYKTLFFNFPNKVSAEELAKDLPMLPQWRQRKVLSYYGLIDRVLSSKAFLLLKEGLEAVFDYRGDIDFEYIGYDKPILKEHPEMHFNLSHCKKGVMCVVADQPVGCDIEEISASDLDMNLLRCCFNEREIQEILSAEFPEIVFTRYWTIKESVLKLTGNGIDDNLPNLLTPILMKKLRIETMEDRDLGYVYSIAFFARNACKTVL